MYAEARVSHDSITDVRHLSTSKAQIEKQIDAWFSVLVCRVTMKPECLLMKNQPDTRQPTPEKRT